jgi:SanA protein
MPIRGRRWLGAAIIAGVCALAAVALGNLWVSRHADGSIFATAREVPKRTFAIVPGASVRADGSLSPALLDRLDAALELYQAGTVERILVSGDAGDNHEADAMADWLIASGVPNDRITRDGAGYRTRTTMEDARRIGIVDAVVCTQAFHLPRSVLWARHVGIDAVGLVADRRWQDHQVTDRMREAVARTVAVVELWLE